MQTKPRCLSLTIIANWIAPIPAMQHFTLAINLMLLLAFCVPSTAQTAQGGKIVSASNKESSAPISNSLLPAKELTDQELASRLDLTLDQVRALQKRLGLSNQQIGGLPLSKLEPALWQLRHPKVDLHAEALKFRRLRLQDEKGQIPVDAWMKAAAQKKLMKYNPQAWQKIRGHISPTSKQGGAIKPLVAGIESSGWTWLGPGNIGGRVRSILIHPTNPSIMWAGSVGGGVWKTLNGGASWNPLDDFMPNLAIACMVMDPANPDIIYAGTGEGFCNIDAIQGAGIFKTTDGGMTWAQLSFTASNPNFLWVNRIAISPANSLVILAATSTGIWRSTDGGATWTQRHFSGTVEDVAFDPSNGSKCVASGNGTGAL